MSRSLLVLAPPRRSRRAPGPNAPSTPPAPARSSPRRWTTPRSWPTSAQLTDVIGPRLSGSPAMRRANDWTAERFRAYGLTAALEPYTFGVTWERGPRRSRLVAPFTPADHRPQLGLDGGHRRQDADRPGRAARTSRRRTASPPTRARFAGAWVLPRSGLPDLEPRRAGDDRRRLRATTPRPCGSANLATADTSAAAVARAAAVRARPARTCSRPPGALGTLIDGAKEHGLMTMSGSPNRVAPLPNIVIAHEDYAHARAPAHRRASSPRLEGRVENTIGRVPVQQWNTVAEIRGSERPGQVVILGAHLDSWDLGTGTTDNGTGSMVVLEAARALAQSGLKPKRTIRFILFSGEEQGLLGSRAYAAAHAAEADSIQAVLVLDNGTGAIAGQALQGRDELEGLWQPAARAGRVARRRQRCAARQERHRPPQLPALRRAGVQLRPAAAGLQPHPPLPERHLRQGRPGRPEAGLRGHGRDGVGAGEPAGAAAARTEAEPEAVPTRPSAAVAVTQAGARRAGASGACERSEGIGRRHCDLSWRRRPPPLRPAPTLVSRRAMSPSTSCRTHRGCCRSWSR